MVQITLPDGSQRDFSGPVTVSEVAQSIGTGLAKAALAGRVTVNGNEPRLVDTSHVIDADASLAIITAKDPDGLDLIRHSTAHLLAYAVKELFPDAQVTIGPVIDNGFYYDFSYKRPFTLARTKRWCGKNGTVTKPSNFSVASANTTKPKSSRRFLRKKASLCTVKAISSTFAVARTCLQPGI